jgi:hypothetical protein
LNVSAVGVRSTLGLLGLTLVLALPASAASRVRLVFDRPAATPHTRVMAKTVGKGALLPVRKRTLKVFLGSDPRVRLGRLSVTRKGNGTLRFNVPNVVPGRYPVLLRGLPGRPTTRVVGSFSVIEGSPLRSCQQSVYGDLGDNWLARSYNLGPIHLVGYDPAEASNPSWLYGPDPKTGQYAVKVLLVIDRGPPVTLAVAAEDRKLVALSYIPGRFNLHRVTDQDPAVTFQPCTGQEPTPPWADKPQTQFNGGFVLLQPLCAHFELTVAGRPEAIAFALPFGKPC